MKTQEIIYTFSYNIDIIPGISIIKKVQRKRYGKGEGDLHGDQGSGLYRDSDPVAAEEK